MRIVSVDEMRRLERLGMEAGVSGYELMRLAGTHAAAEIHALVQSFAPRHRCRFAVLCGKGNNGGDGWVVARWLYEAGERVALYSLCQRDELKDDARRHAEALPEECPVTICPEGVPEEAFGCGTVLVDGLLGTGVTGSPRGVYAETIGRINGSGLPVFALDIPSGVNGDTGEGQGAVRADWTITMGYPKQGLFLKEGFDCSGTVRVVSIGLPKTVEIQATCYSVDGMAVDAFGMADARSHTGRRAVAGFKNTFGHVACLCGSRRYGGAGELCASGALRAGAGLVTLITPGGCQAPGGGLASVIRRHAGDACREHFVSLEEIREQLSQKTSLVIGPGMGLEVPAEFLHQVLKLGLPAVVDADGLRLLGAHPQCLEGATSEIVLTPHPGEMRTLLTGFGWNGEIGREMPERVRLARWLARQSGCTVLLKGRFTVVASPAGQASLNLSGDSSLGTAGSGDVLSGVIGALLGQGRSGFDAARLGAFVHGLSGELRQKSARGLTGDDLPLLVSSAWQEISPLA